MFRQPGACSQKAGGWIPMNQKGEQKMGTESIPKLMVSMAVPSIIAQIINILYNIVDRIYIGHIPGVGAALTGVGITFPIITLISAFSAFVGMGGAPLAAIWLGKGDRKHAEKKYSAAEPVCLLFSPCFSWLFSMVFSGRSFYMFGASDATIGYAMDYMYIYLLGTLFVELALGLNPFIISQGRSRIAMISIVIGAVVNIALILCLFFLYLAGE